MPSTGLVARPKGLCCPGWSTCLALLIILAGALFRLTAYGDVRTSLATMDTSSYMAHAQALSLSDTAFSGERLFTTGILYRIWGAEQCPLDFLSIPAIGRESAPGIESCFAGITSTQTALSVTGWSVLIASIILTLRHGFSRVLASATLSVFAFSPQLADWDLILSSESLALSLFALSLGLWILALLPPSSGAPSGTATAKGLFLGCAGLLFTFLWIHVRDTHVYIAAVMFALALVYAVRTRPVRSTVLIVAIVGLTGCVLAQVAAHRSGRWRVPLTNAFEEYILPYPARVSALQSLGMPQPDSTMYHEWFGQNAPISYAVFLVTHPGFVATTMFAHVNSLFAENNQPYFKTPDLPLRNAALTFGDLVHVKSPAVALLDLALAAGLIAIAVRTGLSSGWARALMMTGLLASAAVTLILTFFADAVGVERHIMLSVALFRLLLWLGIPAIVDLALDGPGVAADV